MWGVHLGWSGDQRYLAQRLNSGATIIGAGEILAAGEVALAAGESITTPWAYGVYSDRGLDGAAARLHAMLRRRPAHPTKPRPIVLNTWEAVYFDHSFERLAELADVAAEIGVERFVVDDGWFGSRRDDTSGLGDWFVSPEVWPAGLKPLADHVRSRGMEFGLWFEPEMVNLDSEVARAHPDWILGPADQTTGRNQMVLDMGRGEVRDHLFAMLDALLSFPKPIVEVHMSNIYRREPFRHHSYISKAATGIVAGLGADGYELALEAMKRLLDRAEAK